MAEPRINVNRLREEVIKACYEWRAADYLNDACAFFVGRDTTVAQENADQRLLTLRIKIDALRREEESLGLI
jgi:hypothetical protein